MLLALALAYLLGLVLSSGVPDGAQRVLGIVALGLSSLVLAGGDGLDPRLWRAPLAVLALFAGLATPFPPSPPLVERGPTRFLGVVESEVVKVDRRSVTVRVLERESGVPLSDGLRIRLPSTEVKVGATVRVSGELVPSLAYRNVSPHPSWPDARPTVGVVPARADRRLVALTIGMFDRVVGRWRDATRRALYATLTPRVAGVAAALVLGDGAMLEDGDAAAIRGAGLTHVLAVSGTHIAMVGGAFVFALERLLRRVPRVMEPQRVAAALGIPFALLHAVFAGSVPSGMRAAVTASIAWALVAAGRRPNALETTAFASLALALPEPSAATRPGFLLSVVATLAVITAEKPRDDSLRESVRVAWALTCRCALATAPIVVHGFGDVPLASLAANLLLVPLGSIALLPVSLVHAALAVASPSLARPTAAVFEPCARAFLEGSAAFGSVDDGIALPPTTALQGLLLVAIVCAMLLASGRTRWKVVAVLAVLYVADEARLRLWPRVSGRFEIHQLDIGQGDSALLRFPDGSAAMIDFGPDRPDVGERVIAPMLRALRIDRLEFAVLTHRHPDHFGGLATTSRAVRIGTLYEPGETDDADRGGTASELLRDLTRRGVRVLGPSALCGHPRTWAGVRLELLSPCPSAPAGFSLNDGSMVLRIEHGRNVFLWVGDAERAAEARMIALAGAERLHADVLKVGHHGSRTSSTEDFLRAVRPAQAVISAGPGNRFSHPHGETLASLRRARVVLHRTDLHGGVRFVSDGRRLRVEHAVW